VSEELADSKFLCTIAVCNATLVYDKTLKQALYVESLLNANIPQIDHRASCTLHIKFGTAKPQQNDQTPGEIKLPEQHLVQKHTIPMENNCTGMSNTVNSSWISFFSDNGKEQGL
jgi:hypothetical protein